MRSFKWRHFKQDIILIGLWINILRAGTKCGFNPLTLLNKGSSYCDLKLQRNVDAKGCVIRRIAGSIKRCTAKSYLSPYSAMSACFAFKV